MINIRKLEDTDMKEAMELKISCWTEELAGKAENTLLLSDELSSWLDWMHNAEEYNDIRMSIGAFENGKMLGVAFASLAETTDIAEKGIELNGLWVYPNQRNRGVSLKMLIEIFNFYLEKGMKKVVIYSAHYAPSNQFYLKFGAYPVRQELQMGGKLLVDVFVAEILHMQGLMEQSLRKYI